MADDTTTDTADEATEVEPDERREALIEAVRADIGDGLVESHLVPGVDLWLRVANEAWPDAIAALKRRGFDFFDFLSGLDWMQSPWGTSENDPFAEPDATDPAPDEDTDGAETEMRSGYAGGDTRFQVFARLSRLDDYLGVTIKADVGESMEIGSVVGSFAGANWHEREAHEMFGISFVGHPDLRNIYLPTEFEGFPLRKDFPLLSRHIKPWPGIVDVEPMPEFPTTDSPADEEA